MFLISGTSRRNSNTELISIEKYLKNFYGKASGFKDNNERKG
jgi:hypothetical protein